MNFCWTYPQSYDVIVVGGGHAGCEASLAAARMGARTLMLTMNLDTIAKMSCNPAIGGVAKGHLVREIDALGGEMAKVIDETGIQFRMLNASKGAAVWSPRAQADKVAYQFSMKKRLEETPGLEIHQGVTESLIVKNNQLCGLVTKEGIAYLGKTVVLSAGTFMRGMIHIGEKQFQGGRSGDAASMGLSKSLEGLGFRLGKLKTGTPPRVNALSCDFSPWEEQKGEEGIFFSYDHRLKTHPLKQVSCYIAYTNEKTKKIIEDNLHRSPMYSGKIDSVGPRYCPSIEDKIVRFSHKDRHQIFVEPEGLDTHELYLNGISSSLPFDVQLQLVKSVPGLENAQITRPAYAIEYDYVLSGQVHVSLESKKIENLFFAGQINGTTGYEEAAAQGLIAGINAASKVQNKAPLILSRSEAYIGVLIDDLSTQDLFEPYRMFTSRAEHRLLLRQDNADLRLSEYAHRYGLIDSERYKSFLEKKQTFKDQVQHLETCFRFHENKSLSLGQILSRPDMSYQKLQTLFPENLKELHQEVQLQLELHFRYAGYISRQEKEIEQLKNVEKIHIPKSFDFSKVRGLRNEAREKLSKVQPHNLAQATRISGVSPADISVLMMLLKSRSFQK